jgi:tRNA A37 threonylcarbamoyladenosine biosynthesis protein TsaE
VFDLALEELADDRGIVLVEWGDVVESLFGDHLDVHLDLDLDHQFGEDLEVDADGGADGSPDTVRMIEIAAVGSSWASRWARLVESCEAHAC